MANVQRHHGDTALSNEVASVLPNAVGDAVTSNLRYAPLIKSKGSIHTSFCPACGGPKGKASRFCRECDLRHQRLAVSRAKEAGHRTLGRRSDERTGPVNEGPTIAPNIGHSLNSARRTRGEGADHRQEWAARIFVDGVWYESQAAYEKAQEQKVDIDPVAALTAWRKERK
jgi:hypothetical protein